MFDFVLRPPTIPRRRIGTGAAFAVALHAWLLVGALAQTRSSAHVDKPHSTELSVVLASPSSPPPLGGGGAPAKSKPQISKWAPARQQLRAPNLDAPPSTAPAQAAPPPAADDAPGSGDSEGGDCVGDCPGSGPGSGPGDPNGVPGGTGTARVSPPPTFLQLNIGDPALDQTTCELRGSPPYPKEALAQKVEGTVVARCTVEPDGALSGCLVLKAPYSFEVPVKAWLDAAHARPFTASGKPARVACNFKLNYKIDP